MSQELLCHIDPEYMFLSSRSGQERKVLIEYCEKTIDRITFVLKHSGSLMGVEQKERQVTLLEAARIELARLQSGQGDLFE